MSYKMESFGLNNFDDKIIRDANNYIRELNRRSEAADLWRHQEITILAIIFPFLGFIMIGTLGIIPAVLIPTILTIIWGKFLRHKFVPKSGEELKLFTKEDFL